MLSELRIENFAIIDRLEFNLAPGLIVFTGETGAGKSIIVDAVEMVLGGRAETTMIRTGADHATIEATFQISQTSQQPVRDILVREELLEEAESLTLGREIRRNGRNIARINGRAVSTSLLNEIGAYLVDVHGQSEHLSLLHVRQHLNLLDNFANVEVPLNSYTNTYRRLQAISHELVDLRKSESEAARRTDILKYQINEIETARLRPGEEEELKEERNRLANAEGLAELLQEALLALDEGTPESPSVSDLLGQVVHSMAALGRLDPSQSTLAEQSQLLFENLADLGRNLRTYHESLEFNPKRLDQVEERLNLIHTLERKYGSSIPDVLEFAQNAGRELETITHVGERIKELEEEEAQNMAQLSLKGQELSKKRRAAAQKMCKLVETELSDLNMSGASFDIQFQSRPDPQGVVLEDGQRVAFDVHGLEHVEFMVAPNPGEGLKPLVKIASGGETSRLMLALKNVLTRADQIPTLIFDEIDQGIGGRVGMVVGQKLRNLTNQHQVFCITHLPQLAAFGEQHFRVEKQIAEGRTHTVVHVVQGEERLLELAQMMGEVSSGTRQSAQELLQAVNSYKK
jgi:DNA repair protein RecN (Recombination protein N)